MKPHTVQEEQTTELVRQQNPDIELELPGRFHSKYKNPCYVERHTNRTRCIGFFSIIGVSKAGTTDVFHRLVSHPKAPHWWDASEKSSSWESYPQGFSGATKMIREGKPDHITGEASSGTFTFPGLRGDCCYSQRRPSLAQTLRTVVPPLRLILMLREPSQRFYAAFSYYSCTYGRPMQLQGRDPSEIPLLFHREALRSVRIMQRCLKHSTPSQCVALHYYDTLELTKGMYSVFLPSWLEAWPREQLLIWRFEDYSAEPIAHLRELARFLKLHDSSWPALGYMNFSRPLNAAGSRARGCGAHKPPMWKKTARLLRRFYQPFNDELMMKLNWSSAW